MNTNVESHDATHSMSLSSALKQATAQLHTLVETHPAQVNLISGRATRGEYAAFLAQLGMVHAILEAALRNLVNEVPAIRGVVRSHHYREAAVRQDLDALGFPHGAFAPLAATSQFLDRLRSFSEFEPLALLGVLYVLEGATNGGRFIAAAVRPALALPANVGTAYLDPHGEQQRERWSEFKSSADAMKLNAQQQSIVIAAACETFKTVYDILEDLNATHRTDSQSPPSTTQ